VFVNSLKLSVEIFSFQIEWSDILEETAAFTDIKDSIIVEISVIKDSLSFVEPRVGVHGAFRLPDEINLLLVWGRLLVPVVLQREQLAVFKRRQSFVGEGIVVWEFIESRKTTNNVKSLHISVARAAVPRAPDSGQTRD